MFYVLICTYFPFLLYHRLVHDCIMLLSPKTFFNLAVLYEPYTVDDITLHLFITASNNARVQSQWRLLTFFVNKIKSLVTGGKKNTWKVLNASLGLDLLGLTTLFLRFFSSCCYFLYKYMYLPLLPPCYRRKHHLSRVVPEQRWRICFFDCAKEYARFSIKNLGVSMVSQYG